MTTIKIIIACCINKKNTTHSIKLCKTLKKEAEKHKKSCKNGKPKNSKRAYHPSREEIHALAAFSKDTMKKEYNNLDGELKNFENMSLSGDKKDE